MSSPLSILVVDDFRFNRFLLRGTLEQLGHVVVEATNAEEACRRIEEARFDVIFLDWTLPGPKGDSVLGRIRHHHLRPRVVAITADTSDAMRQQCMQAGADGFLGKAFDVASVKMMIESVCISDKRPGSHKDSVATGNVHARVDTKTSKGDRPRDQAPPGADAQEAPPAGAGFRFDSQDAARHLIAVIKSALASRASQFPGGIAEALRHCAEQFDLEWNRLVRAVRDERRIDAIIAAHNLGSLAAILDVSVIQNASRKCEDALRGGVALDDPSLHESMAAISIVLVKIQREISQER